MNQITARPLSVLFLAPVRCIGTMAFIIEPVHLLAQRGHFVDLVVSSDNDPPLAIAHANVSIICYRDPPSGLRSVYLGFLRAVRRCVTCRHYDLIIGASEIGLIAATLFAGHCGAPVIYWNLELHFGDERRDVLGRIHGRSLKHLECWANRKAAWTVTQDQVRGRFLSRLNGINPRSLRYFPNSRSGKAKLQRTTYLHDRCGFARDVRVVLWLGGVDPGDGALELARAAQSWPATYRAVFNLRTTRIDPYTHAITQCHQKGQTYVIAAPVPYGEVDSLACSAHIGLGLYRDNGTNNRFVGASSGKINLFLKAGIPCVVSDFPGLRWVEKSDAGVCVRSAEDVLPAVKRISANYDRYVQGAMQLFDERLRCDLAFESLMREIESALPRT